MKIVLSIIIEGKNKWNEMNGFCEVFDSVGIFSFFCVSDMCGVFISFGKLK